MAYKVYTKKEDVFLEAMLNQSREKSNPQSGKADVSEDNKKESREKDGFPKMPKSYSVARNITRGLSFVLIIVGLAIVMYSTYPYMSYYVSRFFTGSENEALARTGDDPSVALLQSRYSDQYFTNVDKNIALVAEELRDVQEDYSQVQGEIYLSVPTINLSRIPVKLNVDSFSKDEYESVLKSRLAHFQGSSIPGKAGTTFVYGHSTAEWYARANPNSFGTTFTYLPNVNIGDEFYVDYGGKRFSYVVVKVHEIHPTDLSPVFENDGRKLFKMMTCTPVGIGTERLIVVGEQTGVQPLN